MRVAWPAAFLALSLVPACKKDFCDRMESLASDCYEVSDEDVEECKDSLKECSDDDQKALNEFAKCFEDLDPTCESSTLTITEDQMVDALACYEEVEDLSEDCAAF